jgi:hypothetical protein
MGKTLTPESSPIPEGIIVGISCFEAARGIFATPDWQGRM